MGHRGQQGPRRPGRSDQAHRRPAGCAPRGSARVGETSRDRRGRRARHDERGGRPDRGAGAGGEGTAAGERDIEVRAEIPPDESDRTGSRELLASSCSVRLTRWCSRQLRTSAPSLLRASLLTAGRKLRNCFPFRSRALRGWNVKPRNVNATCSYEPRRERSLQYTILVLSGCSRSPTSSILFPSAARTSWAWCSVTQCTTPSSAYRSNWMPRKLRDSHMSNA